MRKSVSNAPHLTSTEMKPRGDNPWPELSQWWMPRVIIGKSFWALPGDNPPVDVANALRATHAQDSISESLQTELLFSSHRNVCWHQSSYIRSTSTKMNISERQCMFQNALPLLLGLPWAGTAAKAARRNTKRTRWCPAIVNPLLLHNATFTSHKSVL